MLPVMLPVTALLSGYNFAVLARARGGLYFRDITKTKDFLTRKSLQRTEECCGKQAEQERRPPPLPRATAWRKPSGKLHRERPN